MNQRISLVTLGTDNVDRAVASGGTVQKPAHDAFRGGYSGCFCDPDGRPWEVACNPVMRPGPDGAVTLGD
jgi:uncharacterized glyoxalase superfamily protein PhnB